MTPTDPTPSDRQTLSQLMDGEWHDIDRTRCVAAACADDELRAAWARWHLMRDALRGEGVRPAPASLAARVADAVAREPAYSNVTALPGAALPAVSPAAGAGAAAPDAIGPAAIAPAPVAPPAAAVGATGGARVSRLGVTGFALAASAALVTVVGLNAWQSDAPPAADPAAGLALGPVVAPPAALRVDDAFARGSALAPLPRVDLVANTDPSAGAGSYWVAGDSGVRRGASEARLNAFLSRHIESSPTAGQQGMLPYSRLVGYDDLAAGAAADAPAGADAGR